jgi:hypothetical protein
MNLNLCGTEAIHRGVKPCKAKKSRPKLRLVSSSSRARMAEERTAPPSENAPTSHFGGKRMDEGRGIVASASSSEAKL